MKNKHQWVCDRCNETVLFRQPERDQEDRRSEQNESKDCPNCGGEMFFEDVDEAQV